MNGNLLYIYIKYTARKKKKKTNLGNIKREERISSITWRKKNQIKKNDGNAIRINYKCGAICHMVGTEVCTSINFIICPANCWKEHEMDCRNNECNSPIGVMVTIRESPSKIKCDNSREIVRGASQESYKGLTIKGRTKKTDKRDTFNNRGTRIPAEWNLSREIITNDNIIIDLEITIPNSPF